MDKNARKVLAMAEPLIEALVAGEGCELVDVTYNREPQGWVLRVFIDSPGGVVISDCQGISRQLGDILEGKDVMGSAYSLEVSSPGVNRPLKKSADFERFAGQRVRIKTRVAVQGCRNFLGQLIGCTDGLVHLDVDGMSMQVPLDSISKAHIEYDFSSKK
jgi:ribosome maturation factor RimP